MDHFEYKNGEMFAEDVAIKAIAAKVGTPFYCYSSATLLRHYTVFAEAFAGLNPKICYALKANSNISVIRTLANAGCGADVVSGGEIRIAQAAGIAPDNIVFSGVGKTAEEMAYGLEHNIFQFNVESEPELLRLNEVALSKGVKARIAIRVNPDVNPITHSKISTGQKESKFGIPMEQALPLYALAKSLKGIDVQGVSVHIGSQLTNLSPFAAAFERLAAFVENLRAEGHNIRTLDVGGGLGIPYGHTEPPPLPQAYAEIVKDKITHLKCQLILEPGRLIVGNAGILVSKVEYVKKGSNRLFLILDAGMNDLIRPTLYDAYHAIVPVCPREDAATELMDIVGPVCETGDIFAEQRLIKVPREGDLMAFRSAGAYGAVMSGTYNARLLVPEVLVKGSEYAVIRRRPSYDEQMALEKKPDWF
jgi:diaminopimelate decarboxylase